MILLAMLLLGVSDPADFGPADALSRGWIWVKTHIRRPSRSAAND